MRVLGFIPARGGSKGVPRKNIRPLHGKPLLAYTAEAALVATRLTNVILSTDDPEIAEVGRAVGIDVPFLRPAELAQDNTPTLPVLLHGLQIAEQMYGRFDAVCLLQPTSPLRAPGEIDACITLMETQHADTVFSMLPVPSRFNPHWVYQPDPQGLLHLSTGESTPIPRRQSLPPAYHRDGAIYVARRDLIVEQHTLYGERIVGFLRDHSQSVDIDTLEDWTDAEAMVDAFATRGGITPGSTSNDRTVTSNAVPSRANDRASAAATH